MKRNVLKLSDTVYDLLVVGGGIHGACVAWEACLRGLSVALVEKGDFGSATSANSLKVIHGGLRYLQHGDLRRMRQSILERKTLLRIAPHLIHPLPVLVPTYGHGLKSKEALAIALAINDVVSFDRNAQLGDTQKHIPNGRIISRNECADLVPGIQAEGLTGGALFCDAQVYNSERLLIAFLQSASLRGTDVANYVEVTGLLTDQGNVTGASVKDNLTGNEFDIRARAIVNTSGPWISKVLNRLNTPSALSHYPLAKAVNIVTRSLFDHPYAVGISSQKKYRDKGALLNKGSRFFFTAPWRSKSLVGTAYFPYSGDPDDLAVTEQEISEFLDDFNGAYPSAHLTLDDISFVHQGLLPSSGICQQTGDVQLTKHYHLYDHQNDGVAGLLSVVGVKYTTARGVAQHVVDHVFKVRKEPSPKSISSITPLQGGEIEQFTPFLQTALKTWSSKLPDASIQRLVYCYGSSYSEVLSYLDDSFEATERMSDLSILKAEVRYAVHEEMAQKLSDVVLRRGELGTAGRPNDESLRLCAETMGRELGWSFTTIQLELDEICSYFENLLPKNAVLVN